MIDLANVKTLHLEITSNCNAACPQCDRYRLDNINPNLIINDLSLSDIQSKLSVDFVKQLDKMFMCGNHGDPAAGKDTLEVYKWFRQVNPKIILGMNTNGGIKTKQWWNQLAQVINKERDYVVFSIDGLEDTNHIYRRNVNWQRLMENVKAFINAGGRAHWDMLIFRHNEHQVPEARQLAADLGFVNFQCKVSRRFDMIPVDYLEPPVNYQAAYHESSNNIECIALRERSVYMDSRSQLLPCCWLGVDTVNTNNRYEVQGFIPTANNATCVKTCGTNNKSKYEKQWI
jgi:MoaA/NifB/PqqE/SkfB family radical SAM enzyme